MDDRIARLERLGRLHAEGKLSDAEFAQAKERALSESDRRGPPWWVWVAGVAVIALVALAAWALSPVVQTPNTTETTMPRATDAPEGNFSDYAMPAVIPTPSPVPLPSATPTPTPTPSDTGWAGQYDGSFDGGDGSLTIVSRPGGRLGARLDIAAQGCVGEFSATARDTPGDRIILSRRFEENDEQACTITLDRRGDRVAVDESDCLPFHGSACAFNGTVTRR